MINMKAISTHTLATALALAVAATLAGQVRAGSELIKFPESYTAGVLYATIDRGNITEEIFTSRAAIDAVKNGQPIPSGTVITLVDYRDGELFRYVVMEKRTGQTSPTLVLVAKSSGTDANQQGCAAMIEQVDHRGLGWRRLEEPASVATSSSDSAQP